MNPSTSGKGPFLPEVNVKIEQLEMLGYSVDINASTGSFIISLITSNRRRASYEVTYEDFIIEDIIKQLNELIRRNF